MATKKVLEEDVTKNPQAKTAQDVNNQDSKTRLWQSLSTTYGNQMEESDKAYDKAISQQDNAMLARGMGRSSYAGQIRANMYNDKNTARNKLGENLIADYQNRIAQQDEAEAERAFQTSEREAQQAWQSGENALNRAFQTSEREAQQGYNTSEREATQIYNTSEREAQQGYNTSEREAQQAYQSGENALNRAFQTSEREGQQAYQAGENALNRAFQTSEREAEQAYQAGENALNRAFQTSEREGEQAFNAEQNRLNQAWQSGEKALDRAMENEQFNANMAFQQSEAARNQSNWEISQAFAEKQWQAQQDQWREEFDYEKMSTDQKLYYNYVMKALETRAPISDEMLAKAGLSREDYNAMTRQMEQNVNNGYTGSYGSASTQKPSATITTSTKPTDNSVKDTLNNYNPPAKTTTDNTDYLAKFNNTVKKTTDKNARQLNSNK